MGFLFQQAALYDSLTVEENVAFPLKHNTKHAGVRAAGSSQGIAGEVWAWKAISRRCLPIFPAACRSEWGWRGRWLLTPTSCCSMNPPRDWIPSPPARLTI